MGAIENLFICIIARKVFKFKFKLYRQIHPKNFWQNERVRFFNFLEFRFPHQFALSWLIDQLFRNDREGPKGRRDLEMQVDALCDEHRWPVASSLFLAQTKDDE